MPNGWVYALVLDFEKAHSFISAANDLKTEKAWVKCCEAEILCMEDRWPEALKVAEAAWQLSAGMPQAAATLGRIKAKLGDISGAASTILDAAGEKQSFETLLAGLWYLCAHAERSPKPESEELAIRAWELSKQLAPLAPLADKDLLSHLATTRIDIAWLMNDRERMRSQAKDVQHPFYQSVLKNIEANGPGAVRTTAYKPVFQKHNTCLPTSVASVCHHFNIEVDEDALAAELTYRGTAIWRVVDWLKERGLATRPFVATSEIARILMNQGIPFVLFQKTVSFYHALAAVGIDEEADVLIVHDPSYTRLAQFLLKEIGKGEAPFGPEALAVVPEKEAQYLDLIPEVSSVPFTAFLEYCKARDTAGPGSGRSIIEGLKERFPENAFSRRMEAIYLGLMGKAGAAIEHQKTLLKQFPDCEHIRQELLSSLYQTGNSALIRKILSEIVLQKKIPGTRSTQEWTYPPAEYVSQYANYLGMDHAGHGEAVEMLLDALKREPAHAPNYHVLGDIHRQQDAFTECLLPYRCAATLEMENDHYAQSFLDAMAKVRRIEEGFEFLNGRVDKLGGAISGGEVWATLIGAYEDYGYPDRAIESMSKALATRSDDSYLLSFSVGFWGRMGLKEKESKSLAALQNATNRVHFYTAAVSHYRRIGNWPEALENCRYWLSEEPNNIAARREYAGLWAMAKGMQSALALTKKWMDAKPGNDDLELLYYSYLKDLFKDDEQLAVLRLRLKRNPYDTWAYRELAFTLLDVIDIGGNRDQKKTRIELGQAIQKCQELCPNQAAFFVIKAELAAHDGHHKDAIKHYLDALNLDPEYNYAYSRAWKLAGELSENARRQLFGQLEKRMLRCTGFLYVANDLAEIAANHFGGREAHRIVDRWLRNFPDDPEVAMAKANLLLYNGQGKTDAKKAANLLEVQVVRFPNHAGLRATLSFAYRTLQDEEKWMTCSRELLKQFPLRIGERRQLAEYYERNNDLEHAIRILVEGIRFLPLNHELRLRLITLLFQKGEKEKALAFVKGSLAKIPEDVKFREEIIELLFTNGESKLALEVAEEGTTVYPDGAVLWRIYADALWRSDLTSNMKAVETAYRKALTLNPRYLEAADRLAEFYAYQSRFDEARKICEDQKPFHIQTGEIPTRLAWIERVAGKKDEALMQLTEVVRQWPRERWAWGLLLAWIQEDSNWDLAREVLQNVHPVMSEDPQFVGDKLCVLHKAGVQNRKTEKEWARILSDFPESERIYSQRFDLLLEDQKLEEAEMVLKAIEKFSANSPYILARKTALKADQRQFDQAFAAARSLMALPYFVGDWCGQQVWQAFQDHAKLPYLIQRGLQEWEEGLEIEPNFFRMLVKNLDYVVKQPDSFARFLSFLGFPSRLEKRLKKLLEKSLQRDDQHSSLTAAILDKLEDIGKRRSLIKFAQKHTHFAQTHTKVWQIVGHALLIGPAGKNDEARRWFENWRQRSGCELWSVSNLIIAIENSKKLKSRVKLHSIYKNTADALEILPADHTQQYMVCKYCEATLRLGRSEDFLTAVRRFENLLHDTESGYWQQQGETHLPWVILQFRRLLETDNIEDLNRLKKVFSDEIKNRKVGDWVRAEWKKHVRQVEKDLRGSAAA